MKSPVLSESVLCKSCLSLDAAHNSELLLNLGTSSIGCYLLLPVVFILSVIFIWIGSTRKFQFSRCIAFIVWTHWAEVRASSVVNFFVMFSNEKTSFSLNETRWSRTLWGFQVTSYLCFGGFSEAALASKEWLKGPSEYAISAPECSSTVTAKAITGCRYYIKYHGVRCSGYRVLANLFLIILASHHSCKIRLFSFSV